MAVETVPDDEVVALITSEGGGFALPTKVTFTVFGSGTLWIDTVTHATPDDLRASGIPLVEGQFADEELRTGETVFATAGDGDGEVEVRVLRRGAK